MLRPGWQDVIRTGKNEERLHPGHHSLRLREFDYGAAGSYFVTICSHQKKYTFGRVAEGKVVLTAMGNIVRECLIQTPMHFPRAEVRDFVVMPNHVHFVLALRAQTKASTDGAIKRGESFKTERSCRDGAQHAAPLRVPAGSLGAIVRSFKGAVTQRARAELGWAGNVWQRNYFERILRDGKEYEAATRYILENPLLWSRDPENIKG